MNSVKAFFLGGALAIVTTFVFAPVLALIYRRRGMDAEEREGSAVLAGEAASMCARRVIVGTRKRGSANEVDAGRPERRRQGDQRYE